MPMILHQGISGCWSFKSEESGAGCLTDDLQMVDDPGLNRFFLLERFLSLPSIFLDPLNCLLEARTRSSLITARLRAIRAPAHAGVTLSRSPRRPDNAEGLADP